MTDHPFTVTRTGRTITVQDADGNVTDTIRTRTRTITHVMVSASGVITSSAVVLRDHEQGLCEWRGPGHGMPEADRMSTSYLLRVRAS